MMNELFEVQSEKLIKTINGDDGNPQIEFYEVAKGWSSIEGNFSAIETELEYSYTARKVGAVSDRIVLKHWYELERDIAQQTSRFDHWLTIE